MILHHPQWERVRELLDAGALGTLGHVDAVFTYNNPDRANFRNQRGTGGGGIRDVGVYTYGSARFATGAEPEEISTRIRWEDGSMSGLIQRARWPGRKAASPIPVSPRPGSCVTNPSRSTVRTAF